MVHINRAIDRGNGVLNIELPRLKVGFCSPGPLRPMNLKTPYTTMRRTGNRHTILTDFTPKIQTRPIADQLSNLPPVSIKLISGSEQEPIWDQLVRTHHYLSYQKLIGHRLKYMAYMEEQPVAALSWSAPALKLAARDQFIGWSDVQRKRHLNQLVSNSRFLILPWIKVPNLASHVLSLNIGQLKTDWPQHFSHRLLVLETFIDGRYFNGTCYKAANWLHVGDTYGSGKQGQGYVYHGKAKQIYLYVVDPNFRSIIGCRQKAPCLFHRPPPTPKKVEELVMLLEHCQWHPQLVADLDLDESDVKAMAHELFEFHQQFHGHYGRTEHHRLGLAYLSGLMSNAQAKSVEPIALELLDRSSVRSLQMFMKNYRWNHQGMQRAHQSMLAQMIGRPDGMLTVDSCEFPKKGKESVGVGRQYCGSLGKVENCQSGVFVGYSSDKGYGLLNCQLYMPESWFSKEQQKRRQANLVPEDLGFKTKLKIASELIDQVMATGDFPARWIGCDATFGSDIDFLNALPPDLYYFADIRSGTQVFTKKPKIGLPPYKGCGRRPSKLKVLKGQPKAKSVTQIAGSKRLSWKSVIIAEGAKGPIVAKVARIQVYLAREGLPIGNRQWLFLRKNADGQIKYAICSAPKQTPLSELVKASTMRWPIEQCFQEGKSQLGMDRYEHRSWPAWHRHMIYVFLALHFLLRLRLG
ncbi:MAG TPA: IS701 family transposase, partial [Chromatiaceae bacterium]|nr:IS701 family transposase [Chromatiaceae bacterium]